MDDRMLQLVITALLSGGIATAIATLLTSKALARKTAVETKGLEARLPAEVDSVVVQGAEAAVLTMKAALDSAVGRIGQLEAEREDDRKTITALTARVEELRQKVDKAERAVAEAQHAGETLRHELEALVRQQGGRR